MNFKVTASDSAKALDYISFLRVALNYWVNIDVSYFTFDAIVCPVAVEAPRDSYPGRYTLPPVKEISSPRSDIVSPSRLRVRDAPTSSEASSSLAAF